MTCRVARLFVLVLAVTVSSGCRKSEQYLTGESVYQKYCSTCHQPDGQGIPGAFPPVAGADWIEGDEGRLIRLVLNGMQGPITVRGKQYNNVMTPHGFLTDEQISAVLTFVRSSFGNDAPPVSAAAVAAVRANNPQQGLWLSTRLEGMTGVPKSDSTAASVGQDALGDE